MGESSWKVLPLMAQIKLIFTDEWQILHERIGDQTNQDGPAMIQRVKNAKRYEIQAKY